MNINTHEVKRRNVIRIALTFAIAIFTVVVMFFVTTGHLSSFLITGLDSIRTNCADLISVMVDSPGAFL